MGNIIIIAILAVVLFAAVRSSVKHFKGEGGCCGGSTAVKPERKKLYGDVVCRMIVKIEGMHCENCSNRIERRINEMDGVACRVSLKKKEAAITAVREIDKADIIEAVVELGYEVTAII